MYLFADKPSILKPKGGGGRKGTKAAFKICSEWATEKILRAGNKLNPQNTENFPA